MMDYYGEFTGTQGEQYEAGTMYVQRPVRVYNTLPETKSSVYCVSGFLLGRAAIVISIMFSLYMTGKEHELLSPITCIELANILSIFLMVLAIAKSQPFFCVLFVVCRTMELFFWIVVVGLLGWALMDPRSEAFAAMLAGVRAVATTIQLHHVDIKDLTWQLCLVFTVVGSFALAVTFMATRVAWVSTAHITDAHRYKKHSKQIEHKRMMVASDELYTNY